MKKHKVKGMTTIYFIIDEEHEDTMSCLCGRRFMRGDKMYITYADKFKQCEACAKRNGKI